METKYTNIRVLKEDAEKLKIVASLSRESMLQALHRLVQSEYDRLLPTQKAGESDATLQKDPT